MVCSTCSQHVCTCQPPSGTNNPSALVPQQLVQIVQQNTIAFTPVNNGYDNDEMNDMLEDLCVESMAACYDMKK